MDHVIWCIGHELKFEDIIRGENCILTASSGKRYVDLESGVWCTPLGHCHPDITTKLKEQASSIIHTGYVYANPAIGETARDILEITGLAGGKCVFLCSGSEAVEFGCRAAKQIMDKPLFLGLSDSYFAAYGHAGSKDPAEWTSFDHFPCSRCEHPGNDCSGCPRFVSIPFDRIGCFAFEPGSSSGLVRFAPEKLVRSICRKVKENNGLVLANEITTGTGRTGEWFGYNHYGIQPDIVAIGKGIGNGYPVSVTAVSGTVAASMEMKGFHYGQSHQNDALGAAIAGEVLRVIKRDNLLEECRKKGDRLRERLASLDPRKKAIRAIRGRGLMTAVEIEDGPDCALTKKIYSGLLEQGYIIARRPSLNVFRIDPAFTVPPETLNDFTAAFARAAEL